MKINTNSVLKNYKSFITKLSPKTLDELRYSTITARSKYKKTLEITETPRTEEEKRIAYSLIEESIKEMQVLKEPILVDNLFFAISYPESYNLVTQYYDILTETCLNNKKFMGFDGTKFSPLHKKGKEYVINKIKQLSQSTYTLYFELHKDNDFLKKEGNFDPHSIEIMRHKYDLLKCFTNETEYDRKKAYEIYFLIKDYDYTLEKIVNQFRKNQESIHNLLKNNLKPEEYRIVLEKFKSNTRKKYAQIQHIIEQLYNYIPNGIEINENETRPFTMLDYYSLTNLNPTTILAEIDKKKTPSKAEGIARGISKKFIKNNKNQGATINRDLLIKRNMKLIRGDKEYNIADYADELINMFKEYNIPTYANLLEIAFTRIVRNQQVFPLINKEEKDFSL